MALNQRIGQKIAILSVLKGRGLLAKMRIGHDRIQGPCPIHGGDNPQAFVVTLSKNLWYCFTGCRRGGDSVDLIQGLDNCSFFEAIKRLKQGHEISKTTSSQEPLVSALFRPFKKKLTLNPVSLFLLHKRITSQTANFFETGEYYAPGFLNGCVGIRLHSPVGSPLGYVGRRLNPPDIEQYGKWKFPSKLPKSNLLFNLHRTNALPGGKVVVTECPWGVMRLHHLGIPAVSIMGVHTSTFQLNLLKQAKAVFPLLDGDAAGILGANSLAEKLNRYTDVRIINLPQGKDPDDLSDQNLIKVLAPFFSFN